MKRTGDGFALSTSTKAGKGEGKIDAPRIAATIRFESCALLCTASFR
jgi:hypothetical protein